MCLCISARDKAHGGINSAKLEKQSKPGHILSSSMRQSHPVQSGTQGSHTGIKWEMQQDIRGLATVKARTAQNQQKKTAKLCWSNHLRLSVPKSHWYTFISINTDQLCPSKVVLVKRRLNPDIIPMHKASRQVIWTDKKLNCSDW